MFEFKLTDKAEAAGKKVYAKVDDENTFTEYSPNNNGVYRIAKHQIASNNLAHSYDFEVQVGDQTAFKTNASPMTYISRVLAKSTRKEEKEVLTALYEYWYAACQYQQNNGNQ